MVTTFSVNSEKEISLKSNKFQEVKHADEQTHSHEFHTFCKTTTRMIITMRECTLHKTLIHAYLNIGTVTFLTCVAHKFRYFREGSLMSCSAHALVTCVKARLRTSRLPNEPQLSSRAMSVSVDRLGNVSFRGPPFCCYNSHIRVNQQILVKLTLELIVCPLLKLQTLTQDQMMHCCKTILVQYGKACFWQL
jgi:hypothetical protein